MECLSCWPQCQSQAAGDCYIFCNIIFPLFHSQPLSAGNHTEFSQTDNSKTVQHRAINPTSLDSLGSCESIYVYFKPIKLVER